MGDEVIQENQETELQNQETPLESENDISTDQVDNSINSFPQDDEINQSDQTPTIVNENTTTIQMVEVDGQVITLNEAFYREQIKTNFYLSLILIVTVVFFVINKFWAWCRLLPGSLRESQRRSRGQTAVP